jgi:D-alanyl-D-alanine carboxypeptidase (penicillin-binding protein 5/6)
MKRRRYLMICMAVAMAINLALSPCGRELGAIPPFPPGSLELPEVSESLKFTDPESQIDIGFVINWEEYQDPYGEAMVETSPVSGVGAQYPHVSANAAVLMDGESGQVCYERQAHSLRPPASTTKIMTAILGIESGQLDKVVTVSEKAAATGEASLHLQKGQTVQLRELIEGALVRSGNDACVAIAEAVSGEVEFFAQEMNRKAVVLGAVNTRFVNPNGLPHAAHLSTAYDLALMARYALKDQTFAHFVNETYGKFDSINPRSSVDIKNTNKLLHMYPLADGVKTGTTNAAGKCLVASATKDGRQLICVVLDAPDRYGDCQRLFEWGFSNTENVEVGKKGDHIVDQPVGKSRVPFRLSADVNILVKKGEAEKLSFRTEFPDKMTTIRKGEAGGSYVVFIGEKEVFRCSLVADADVETEPLTLRQKFKDGIENLRKKVPLGH